jgi:hypothetical protein
MRGGVDSPTTPSRPVKQSPTAVTTPPKPLSIPTISQPAPVEILSKPNLKPPSSYIYWPKLKGCINQRIEIIKLAKGTLIDRVGDGFGTYCGLIEIDNDKNPIPASWQKRSLPYLGQTKYPYVIDGKNIDLREELYKMIYNETNDPEQSLYGVYEVISEDAIEAKFPCVAEKAFDYIGGAFQLELPESINDLIAAGKIKKLTLTEIRDKLGATFPTFPPYRYPNDDKPETFQLFDRKLRFLVDLYKLSTPEARDAKRAELGLPPATPITETANALFFPATVHPSGIKPPQGRTGSSFPAAKRTPSKPAPSSAASSAASSALQTVSKALFLSPNGK